MKRKFAFITLSLLIITSLFSGCASQKSMADQSLSDIKAKGQFIVGLDDSFPPMGFKDDNGNIVGFDIDMATEAAKRMGVKATFKPVQWDGIILSLNNKDIDVIWNGLTITEKRKEQISISKPYLENKQIIVVANASAIKDKSSLTGKKVGLQLGSSSETALTSDTVVSKSIKEIKKYNNNTEALMDLAAGRIDAVVIDEVVGRYYVQKKPGVYKILSENFGSEQYGVGLRKNDKTFLDELNKTLDAMKADGTADKISEKWFGSKIISK